MKRRSLIFKGPQRVEVSEESFEGPQVGQVLVKTLMSGISPGTEMLFYRGLVPENMPLDATIPALSGTAGYPFKYGYCCVGEVQELGHGVEHSWLGRQVFSFHPHESYFCAGLDDLYCLPEGMQCESAIFLPNMETATNLVMDGAPLLGETAAVFGLGVVGLLTTALLSQFPLEKLVTFDKIAQRRQEALKLGVTASLDPSHADLFNIVKGLLPADTSGLDLAYELSGSPQAINQAIEVVGFDGRIVIGSWYGKQRADIDLGGKFHRSRIRLISSQVSTLAPGLSGRWTKKRRLETACKQLENIQPQRWITHRVVFEDAALAYRQLAEKQEETIQIVLTY